MYLVSSGYDTAMSLMSRAKGTAMFLVLAKRQQQTSQHNKLAPLNTPKQMDITKRENSAWLVAFVSMVTKTLSRAQEVCIGIVHDYSDISKLGHR
uniref:Uncharacterized protein n=1 Tax=Timema tahoe TaxID=61484 RepID=A0A7R9NVE9_9NEOP|nr:unnamed protein product [Timema tahoe]